MFTLKFLVISVFIIMLSLSFANRHVKEGPWYLTSPVNVIKL